MAEAVLLNQRFFWVGTTPDPEATIAEHMPDNLFTLGFAHLGVALVVLVLAQLVFARLEISVEDARFIGILLAVFAVGLVPFSTYQLQLRAFDVAETLPDRLRAEFGGMLEHSTQCRVRLDALF